MMIGDRMAAFEEIDIHRMTKVQAMTAVDAKLKRLDSSVYNLRVIHGYHGGTALRDMIRARYAKHPKVKRIELGMNPGETTLILRELW